MPNKEISTTFAHFAKAIHPLSDADLSLAANHGKLVTYSPGDVMLNQGELAEHFAFVISGLVTSCYATSEGSEYIRHFWNEGTLAGPYVEYLRNERSKARIIAVERTTCLQFEFAMFDALAAQSHAWALWTRKAAERLVVQWEERYLDVLSLDAGTRLAAFEARFQHLLPRLKKNQIAAYLGITPEALSRILKQRG